MATHRTHLIGAAAVAILGVALARTSAPAAKLADPTFTKDVAPILYKNCTVCHRPSGIGPFSLLDYDSAKANLDDIHDAVQAGVMPPWHATGPHGVFSNDRRLSDADKETILRWIATGAKPGDPKDQPPKPVYSSAWTIGTPDAVVAMPEDFTVPAAGTVEYQYFQVPTNFTEDKWVQAIEIMPGAREVVHHVLVFAAQPMPANPPAPPPAAAPGAAPSPRPAPLFIRQRDQNFMPDEARTDTLHPPPRNMGSLIGTETPGNNVMVFPKGAALRIRAGTVITFQMHYTAHGHEMKDRTKIGFKFADGPPDEEIFASHFFNGGLNLPAGVKDVQVPADLGFGQPIRIWGMMPHTHLRGTRWQYTLVKPDSSTEVILDVPHYDFNWQTYYMFAKPLDIAAGSKIHAVAWYDNSASNKNNPDPTKDVKWGDQTWEEMQYTGFLYSIPGRKVK
jgi:mono/diheme cytochrome c family protein